MLDYKNWIKNRFSVLASNNTECQKQRKSWNVDWLFWTFINLLHQYLKFFLKNSDTLTRLGWDNFIIVSYLFVLFTRHNRGYKYQVMAHIWCLPPASCQGKECLAQCLGTSHLIWWQLFFSFWWQLFFSNVNSKLERTGWNINKWCAIKIWWLSNQFKYLELINRFDCKCNSDQTVLTKPISSLVVYLSPSGIY